MRVLVIEDDKELAETVAAGLRDARMAVDVALDGEAGLARALVNDYEVIVLDRDLPVVHGDEVCARLVAAGGRGRVLMLTGAAGNQDLVDGLGLGADDYLAKPFAFAVLVARIGALARRAQPSIPPVLAHGDIVLDTARRSAHRGARPLALRPKEFGVLELLLAAQGRVVSAEELLERVWDENADPFTATVKITISRLRAKLGDPPVIETVARAGLPDMSIATRLNSRITRLAVGRHLPHRTVRVRLTLLYGGLFLLSGAALMAISYALLVNAGFVFTLQNATNTELAGSPPTVAHTGLPRGFPAAGSTTHPSAQTMAHWRTVAQCMRSHGVSGFPDPTTSLRPSNPVGTYGVIAERDGAILAIPATINTQSPTFTQATTACGFMADHTTLTSQDNRRRTQTRQQLLIQSGIALAGMSLLSLGLGWLVAGRVLQPLEDSYEAQRQFVANASHELRAPLTRMRTLSEVAVASSEANVDSLRRAHERVLAAEQHLEQLIDALLALTRGQAGLERREHLDLAALTSEALFARQSELAGLDLVVRTTLDTAPAAGDQRLLERLIANLLDNAIRHNSTGGHLEITTGIRDRRAFLAIANTGPPIPPEQIERLFQPFQRLDGARTSHNNGHGLGLSIVQAISKAHDAELNARARPEGGLTIEISFPPATGASSGVTSASPRTKRSSPPVISETDAPAGG